MAKEKKQQFPKVVSSAAVAAYSWLAKPDTGHKFSDDKYKVTLVIDADEDLSRIEEACVEAAKMRWGNDVPEDLVMPIKSGDDHKNEEFDGKLLITAKSKFQPTMIDAKRNELAEDVIKSGDLIKASLSTYPYESTEKVREKGKTKTVTVYGVSLQLRGVQLLEKRNHGADATDDFEDESDYDAYEGKASRSTESDDDNDDGDADDF